MIVFNKNSLFILFLFFTYFANGQGNPHLLPEYNFVNYDTNYIHFYNDHANFSTFFNQLDTLIFQGKGKINIMQIGGSHIQADIWSNKMRVNFQQLSPNLNGGRGFLFPFTLANTNNPYEYKVTYTGKWEGYRNSVSKHNAQWGVSGITATTTDSVASFKLIFRSNHSSKYDFNSIKIFHDLDTTSFCIQPVNNDYSSVKINKEIGYTVFEFDTYQDSLAFEVFRTDTSQTHFNLYGISLENDDPGIIYDAIGVNGASTKSYLRCQLFTQHLKALMPDLVIFCIGINDAYDPDFCVSCYEQNYDTLVSWIKSVNPNASFLFVTNNDSYYKQKFPNERVEEARQIMMKLTKKYNAGLWDLYEIMGGLGAIKVWEDNGFAKKDKIHFTAEGYQLIGDLMFSALIKEYDKHIQIVNSE